MLSKVVRTGVRLVNPVNLFSEFRGSTEWMRAPDQQLIRSLLFPISASI